jgi:type IX secretion system PorP/SprF family membrane protein
MKSNLILLLTAKVLLLYSSRIFGQQDVQLTQFMSYKLSINPGAAGLSKSICTAAIYRTQWTNFNGSPKTGLFNFQMPAKVLRGGVGFTYYNDKIGFESNNIARLHYSYHTSPGGIGDLGIGVSAGIISKSINPLWVTPSGDPWSFDSSIAAPGSSDVAADFSLGFYYTSGKLYLGLSSTHVSEETLEQINVQTARHYWLMAGYMATLCGSPQFEIQPNVLAKSDGASTQIDVNTLIHFRRQLWAGVGYRVNDAISPMVGVKCHWGHGILNFGYSYDVTTSNLNSYSNGSHEITINYCFRLMPFNSERYTNPR